MKTKNCTKCNKTQSFLNFSKSNSCKYGVSSICKKCQYKLKREHEKRNPWVKILQIIQSRCNNPNVINYKRYGGRGIRCLITAEELKELWFRDKAYLMNRPSIDRKGNDGNYCLENCRFIELRYNIIRSISKPIIQFNLQGIFIKEWPSILEAQKILKISSGEISKCCSKKRRTAKNFIWKFKESE